MYNEIIKKGYDYIEVIKDISNGADPSLLFKVLDAISLEPNFHLGLRLAEEKGFGDKSWFYCYEGDIDTYKKNNTNPEDPEEVFFSCYDKSEVFKIFDHLLVESSEMGAWQAYLLSVAMTMLPTTWHGAYFDRKYIFQIEDLWNHGQKISLFGPRFEQNEEYEVAPQVIKINDNTAISACYWNDWEGLVREKISLSMLDGKVHFKYPFDKEVLYKYKCGIKF